MVTGTTKGKPNCENKDYHKRESRTKTVVEGAEQLRCTRRQGKGVRDISAKC
jgi:hypothetical protein